MSDAKYELLLKGGRVVDPARGLDEVRDVAIRGTEIAAVERDIPASLAATVEDVSGNLVVPGLIDYHTHCYWGHNRISVHADHIGAKSGVTTWVDTGSAGAANFPGFYHHVIKTSAVDIIPYLNISWIGCAPFGPLFVPYNELLDPRLLDSEEALRVCGEFEGVVAGIKLRASSDVCGAHGMAALRIARFVADAMRLPLMIHLSIPPLTVDDILPVLREGDTFTHCFTPFNVGVLDYDRKVRPIMRDAKERGVILDIGHGAGSFSFPVAEAAMGQGLLPDCISTDLSRVSVDGPAYDLPTVMSKFLALGMSFDEVLDRATRRPAACLGLADRLGGLAPGRTADIAVLEFEDGSVDFVDTRRNVRTGNRLIRAVKTIKGGRVLPPLANPGDEAPTRRPGMPGT